MSRDVTNYLDDFLSSSAQRGKPSIARLNIVQAQKVSGVVTMEQITGNQNDYLIPYGDVFRLSSDASRNITGLANVFNGRIITLINTGAQDIVLTNQDAASIAPNRMITTTGASITLNANESAILVYDGTDSRWRMIVTSGA